MKLLIIGWVVLKLPASIFIDPKNPLINVSKLYRIRECFGLKNREMFGQDI